MSDNVLREFLVRLGFAIDETSMKKFENAVERTTKTVLKLGAEVTAAATGVVVGVKIISSQMENLYYASQRTGATVGNIMALRYAAGQIGLTADQAQGALENFARTLRLNPGSNSLLDSLGVKGGNPADRFTSFIEKMKGMQPYVAAAYAQLFGIDPDTLLMLENGLPKLQAEKKKYASKLAAFGIDPDQAAEAGKDFNNSIRAVKDTFNDVWIVIESKLAPVLTPLVNEFERFAENHASEVAQGIADAVQHIAEWVKSVDWKKLGDEISTVYHALGGLKGVLIAIAGIKLASIIGGVGGLTGAIQGLVAAGAGFAGWKIGDALRDTVDTWLSKKTNGKYRSIWDLLTGTDRSGLDATGGFTQDEVDSMKEHGGAKLTPPRSAVSGAPRGIRNNNPGNIVYGEFAKSMGATGSDGRFAVFDSMEDGIRAAVRLLQGYLSKGYDTIRKIISRWAPAGENNTAAYIDAVAKQLGISADAKLSGDQLIGVAQGIFTHENGRAVTNVASLSQARLGGGGRVSPNVNMQQHNEFHIVGTNDPQGTARAVGAEQSRVNGDMVRNFAGAFS